MTTALASSKQHFVRLPRNIVDTLPGDQTLREEIFLTGLLDAQVIPPGSWSGPIDFPARKWTLTTVRLRFRPCTWEAAERLCQTLGVARNALFLEAYHHALRNPACIGYNPEYARRYPLLDVRAG